MFGFQINKNKMAVTTIQKPFFERSGEQMPGSRQNRPFKYPTVFEFPVIALMSGFQIVQIPDFWFGLK
jgi:hypothetical protein